MPTLIPLVEGDVKLQVKATTPRIKMEFASLGARYAGIYKAVAAKLHVNEIAVDNAMNDFAYYSSHVVTAEGLDFELANLGDDDAELERKFVLYLDTELSSVLSQVRPTIDLLDNPAPPLTRPQAPSNASKN